MLTPEQYVGQIDVATLPSRKVDIEEEKRIALAREEIPLVSLINLHDFEVRIPLRPKARLTGVDGS